MREWESSEEGKKKKARERNEAAKLLLLDIYPAHTDSRQLCDVYNLICKNLT